MHSILQSISTLQPNGSWSARQVQVWETLLLTMART